MSTLVVILVIALIIVPLVLVTLTKLVLGILRMLYRIITGTLKFIFHPSK